MITTEINGKKFEIDGQDFFSPAEERTIEDWLLDMRAQDAANKRHRSLETINTHRKHIREKTSQHSGTGVLAFCLSREYIRILMLAGFAATMEPVVTHSTNQPVRTVRGGPRIGRNREQSLFEIAAGGLH